MTRWLISLICAVVIKLTALFNLTSSSQTRLSHSLTLSLSLLLFLPPSFLSFLPPSPPAPTSNGNDSTLHQRHLEWLRTRLLLGRVSEQLNQSVINSSRALCANFWETPCSPPPSLCFDAQRQSEFCD